MFDLLAQILAFFYERVPNYGIAIGLLTLAVMVVLTPLTLKGTRSMMMMQAVQPEMKRLQAQYKDDRQKLNEELLKFYKENNINPLSGCLPLLIQMPVFFILYRVIHGLTQLSSDHLSFNPSYLDQKSKLFTDLIHEHPPEMRAFGMDLATSARDAMSHSFGTALPYIILIVAVATTSFIQQRQISGRNPAAASNPQQQLLMKLGPIMITFISLISPGGLVIYFFVSNLYRVGQQALISHTIYGTPEAKAMMERQVKEAEEKKKNAGSEPPKGFFQKLLGDAAPRLDDAKNKGKTTNGKASSSTNGKAKTPPKDGGGATAKPPAAKNGGGRVTPPGSRSSASRKKKRK